MLSHLEAHGVLHREGERWHWMADSYPAGSVSLRAVADGNFVVIDSTGGSRSVIAEVDYSSAALTLYEGAIYLIQAAPGRSNGWTGRGARRSSPGPAPTTTPRPSTYPRSRSSSASSTLPAPGARALRGEVHVVRRVAGYKKIRYYTHENVGYGPVNLPDHEMHTTAVWWQIDPAALQDAFPLRSQALEGFLGAAYAMHYVALLLTMSDRLDLGRAIGDGEGRWFAALGKDGRGKLRSLAGEEIAFDTIRAFQPTLFLYDNYPGGIGLSAPLFDLRCHVIERARELVAGCACKFGCPACVGPILASDDARGYSTKDAALLVLRLLGGSG